jgi:hypothetical protein
MTLGLKATIRRCGLDRCARAPQQTVFVVCTTYGVEQVFARRADAERYSSDLPDSQISARVVRRRDHGAVVIFERHVVVSKGMKVLDQTTRTRRYLDDLLYAPCAADIESFHVVGSDDWHIYGVGTDQFEIDTKVRAVIAKDNELGKAPTPEASR